MLLFSFIIRLPQFKRLRIIITVRSTKNNKNGRETRLRLSLDDALLPLTDFLMVTESELKSSSKWRQQTNRFQLCNLPLLLSICLPEAPIVLEKLDVIVLEVG